MEEEWAKNAYPKDISKIERAKKEESEVKKFLEDNPKAEIVLSHLPPFGVLDSNPSPPKFLPESYPKNCGSKLLLEYIKKNQPELVFADMYIFLEKWSLVKQK
jgi:Icc-related predicted phosphoesterase